VDSSAVGWVVRADGGLGLLGNGGADGGVEIGKGGGSDGEWGLDGRR